MRPEESIGKTRSKKLSAAKFENPKNRKLVLNGELRPEKSRKIFKNFTGIAINCDQADSLQSSLDRFLLEGAKFYSFQDSENSSLKELFCNENSSDLSFG